MVPLRNTQPSYANVYWAVKSYMSRVGFINTLESKLGFPLEPCDYWHDSHICQGFCLYGSQQQASEIVTKNMDYQMRLFLVCMQNHI